MYKIEIDKARNCLFLTLEGYIDDETIKDGVEELLNEADKLERGFTIVNDISKFKPVSSKSVEYMKKAQRELSKKGARRTFRVVGKSVVSKLQMDRTQKESGASYKTITVATKEEALKAI
ncbi:MAG: hypothetical protein ACLFSQ_08890 [Candidatus Zixiibacteriota bacterium]